MLDSAGAGLGFRSMGSGWVRGRSSPTAVVGIGVAAGAGVGTGEGGGGSTAVEDVATRGVVIGGVIDDVVTGGGMALLLASSNSCLELPRVLATACSSRDARL